MTYGKMHVPFKNDVFAVAVGRGQVDPTDDAERSVALGTTSLDKLRFDRKDDRIFETGLSYKLQ